MQTPAKRNAPHFAKMIRTETPLPRAAKARRRQNTVSSSPRKSVQPGATPTIDRPLQQQATLYLLGELDPEARAAFESRQEADAGLRAFVREGTSAMEQVMLALPPGEPRAAPAVRKSFLTLMAEKTPEGGLSPLPEVAAIPGPEPRTEDALALRSDRQARWTAALALNATLALIGAAWLSIHLWQARDAAAEESRELRVQRDAAGVQIASLSSAQQTSAQVMSDLKERNENFFRENAVLRQEVERTTRESRTQSERMAREIQALSSDAELARLQVRVLRPAVVGDDEPSAPLRGLFMWDPLKQLGLLSVENLPQIPAQEDYQLWLVNPAGNQATPLGVIHPTRAGPQTLQVRLTQNVGRGSEFRVTLERKGGGQKMEGPTVLVSER